MISPCRYNKTPVIKASGRELCYMLLIGILLCYCMSFVILAPPNIWSCASLRVGIGLCLSICYSAIFIKTNRISRIFNQGVKSIQRPLYTSPISQVAISSGGCGFLEGFFEGYIFGYLQILFNFWIFGIFLFIFLVFGVFLV
jgi:MFS family permease